MDRVYNLSQAKKILDDLYKELDDDIGWVRKQDDNTRSKLAEPLVDTRADLAQAIEHINAAEDSLRKYTNKRRKL